MRNPFSNHPKWIVSIFQNVFMGFYDWGSLTCATYIYQFDARTQKWKSRTKSSLSFGVTACRIKNHVILINSGSANMIELLSTNENNVLVSNKICSTSSPLNDGYGFSLTAIDAKSVILAEMPFIGDLEEKFPLAFRGKVSSNV